MSGIPADPFRERNGKPLCWRTRVLGAPFEFACDSRELLDLAREAFADVPAHRWPRDPSPMCRVVLRLSRAAPRLRWAVPPVPVLSSGGGLLCAHADANNFAIVDPGNARALVQVTGAMLQHRRLLRYELIEFAVLTLGARTQRLIPLHAACLGLRGQGVLLLGDSGAGKSTLALHAALAGLEFLSEDSVFVQPVSLLATGLSAFVHARTGSTALIADARTREVARRSPRIHRRSGVEKLEIDLRGGIARLAQRPLEIRATVVLTARPMRGAPRLTKISAAHLRRVLRHEQGYATSQPGWPLFERRLLRAGGYLLARSPPADSVAALRALLGAAA